MRREKTVSGSSECLFSRKAAGLLSCFCCNLFLFIFIFPFLSPTSVIAHSVARSEFLYFLYPSLKFLSSHNSLRNFFSPSRGEIKMFRLTKLKISTIFLNKSNFLNPKRLCLFASSLPSCLAAKKQSTNSV